MPLPKSLLILSIHLIKFQFFSIIHLPKSLLFIPHSFPKISLFLSKNEYYFHLSQNTFYLYRILLPKCRIFLPLRFPTYLYFSLFPLIQKYLFHIPKIPISSPKHTYSISQKYLIHIPKIPISSPKNT